MYFLLVLSFVLCPAVCAQKVIHETTGREILEGQYFQTVSEKEIPVETMYIKTQDGLYVAATLRKPHGDGPFPTMVIFHGWPGGRGMAPLVDWSLGKCGGPLWEGFLREGYVVVVGDYRGQIPPAEGPATATPPEATPPNSMASDALALIDHVRTLPYVDNQRIGVYGVSLGGDVALHVAARTSIRALILGAPEALHFMGADFPRGPRMEDYSEAARPTINPAVTKANISALQGEILLLVGTKDRLMPVTLTLYEQLRAADQKVELHIYRNGYHDFPMGPQCNPDVNFPQPFIDATEESYRFTLRWLQRVMQ